MPSRLLAVFLISAAIGAPGAFFVIALPALLRESGASLGTVGLVYVVWAPSALKWLWAPWFDRLPRPPFGSAFGWMRALALLMAALFLPVAFMGETLADGRVLLLALASACLAVTLQLLIAGWLMADFDEASRAAANGFAVAGMVFGGALGGGLLPYAAQRLGWSGAVWAVALLIAACGLLATAGRRGGASAPPAAREASSFSLGRSWAALRRLEEAPRLLALLGLAALSSGADALVPARLVDAGFDPVQTSLLLGVAATLAVVPAAAAAGGAMRRWGTPQVFCGLCLVKAGVFGALAGASAFPPEAVAGLALLDFVLAGAMTVGIWQLVMGRCAGGGAAVGSYALLTAADAAVRLAAGIGAGALGMAAGYGGPFVLAALLVASAAVFALPLKSRALGASS